MAKEGKRDIEKYDDKGRLILQERYDAKGKRFQTTKIDYDKGIRSVKGRDTTVIYELDTNKIISRDRFKDDRKPKTSVTAPKNYTREQSIKRIDQLQKEGYTTVQATELARAESKGNKRQTTYLKSTYTKRKDSNKAIYGGTVGGKYYDNLTREELETQRLSSNTSAKFNPERTKSVEATREAAKTLTSTGGTSADQFTYSGRGAKEFALTNVRSTASRNLDKERAEERSRNLQEANKEFTTEYNKLSKEQKEAYKINLEAGLSRKDALEGAKTTTFNKTVEATPNVPVLSYRASTPTERFLSNTPLKPIIDFTLGVGQSLKGDYKLNRPTSPSNLNPQQIGQAVGGATLSTVGAGATTATLLSPVGATLISSVGIPIFTGLTAGGVSDVILTTGSGKDYADLSNSPLFKTSLRQAREDTAAQLKDGSFTDKLKYVGTEFLPLTKALTEKETLSNMEARLIAAGVPESERVKYLAAAERRLFIGDYSEGAAILGSGAITELLGVKNFKELAKKGLSIDKQAIKEGAESAFKAAFTGDAIQTAQKAAEKQIKKTVISRPRAKFIEGFKITAPLGAGEGIAQEVGRNIARDEEIKTSNVVTAGVFGALFAGFVGGRISQLQTAQGIIPKSDRLGWLTGANILDPTELPSDLVAGRITSVRTFPENLAETITERTIIGRSSKYLFTDVATPDGTDFAGRINSKVFTPSVPTTVFDKATASKEVTTVLPSTDIVTRQSIYPKSVPFTFTPSVSVTNPFTGTLTNFNTDIPSITPKTTSEFKGAPTSTNTPVPTLTSVNTNTGASIPTSTSVPVSVSIPVSVPVSTSVPINTTVPATVVVPTIRPKLPKFLQEEKKKQAAYDVYIKEKGKFTKFNKVPLSKSNALRQGDYFTDNSTAASFKIKRRAKETKVETPVNPVTPFFNSNNYRKSKKNKNVYVEKNANRINSEGERRGITAKGLATLRAKRSTVLGKIKKPKRGFRL